MSPIQRKSYDKMSLKHDKSVPELIKKYRSKYPYMDRDLLRKLIRLEKKIENPSELKKLDRYLRQEFRNEEKPSTQQKEHDELDKYVKELKEIGDIAYSSTDLAWNRFAFFQTRLRPELKEKIGQRVLAIAENHSYNDSVGLKIAIDNVCTILYEYYRNPGKSS